MPGSRVRQKFLISGEPLGISLITESIIVYKKSRRHSQAFLRSSLSGTPRISRHGLDLLVMQMRPREVRVRKSRRDFIDDLSEKIGAESAGHIRASGLKSSHEAILGHLALYTSSIGYWNHIK